MLVAPGWIFSLVGLNENQKPKLSGPIHADNVKSLPGWRAESLPMPATAVFFIFMIHFLIPVLRNHSSAGAVFLALLLRLSSFLCFIPRSWLLGGYSISVSQEVQKCPNLAWCQCSEAKYSEEDSIDEWQFVYLMKPSSTSNLRKELRTIMTKWMWENL